MISRRAFVGSAAAALTAGCVRPRPAGIAGTGSASRAGARLPIGFSTLGCPSWDWPRVLDRATAYGFGSIELRGIQQTMDLTKCAEFQPARLVQTKQELAGRALVISDLGSSANLHEMDEAKHAAELAHARSFIELAGQLGTPYVRVFGNKFVAGVPREAMLAHIAAGLRTLGGFAREHNVVVLLESHGDFTDSPTLLELMRRADSPGAALLWDAHHTFAFSNEQPEATVQQLGRYIRHTHLKDSVRAGTDRRYVLTGTGEVPVRRQVEALVRAQYAGWFSFEWEKRWHKEIEEPEVAFPQFASVVSGYLSDAGVSGRPGVPGR